MNPDVARKIDEIRRDREHGASWLSREAIAVMKFEAESSQAEDTAHFLKDLENTAQMLAEARRSMVSIKNMVCRFIRQVQEESEEENLEILKKFTLSLGNKLIQDSRKATLKAARIASELIQDGDRVMSSSYSQTVCEVFKIARTRGRHFQIIIAESRASGKAYGEMAKDELISAGIPTEVIPDDSIAHNIPRVDKVLVGADAVLTDGSLINGKPSYDVALAAKDANIPFYSISETSKLDYDRPPDHELELEEGFERIPPHLLTGIITEEGIIRPEESSGFTLKGL